MDTGSKLSGVPLESWIGAAIALGILALFFAIIIRQYWSWYHKRKAPVRKPTLFDVRELLTKGEKVRAIKVYREIFNVDQKEAQIAVDALEKNLRP
jgi:hypothetical protein